MSTEIARIYSVADYYCWPGPVMHRSNHDPLWLHNFGQPGYQTAIDYGQHCAREEALQAAYVASGAAAEAAGRYAAALAAMRAQGKRKPTTGQLTTDQLTTEPIDQP